MNKLTLIGYVGGEPEIRLTKVSDPVCNFRVATNEWISHEHEHTEWFNVVSFGKLALQCSKRIIKGSRVYIEGTMRSETYMDRTSNKRVLLKVYASTVIFLDNSKNIDIHSSQSLEISNAVE